jgi:hypothetical protein
MPGAGGPLRLMVHMEGHSMRVPRLSPVAAAPVIVALLLGACGGAEESPTPTPAATATPEPQSTASAEEQYRDAAGQILAGLADLLLEAAEVLERADVESEEWRSEGREALEQLRAHHEEAERLDPPPDLEETHKALLAATGQVARAAELLADGLDTQDADLLEAAAEELLHSVVAIEEARLAFQQ